MKVRKLLEIGKLGQDEGPTTGPAPGEGADLSEHAAAFDVEGTPPDALPGGRGPTPPPGTAGGQRTWLARCRVTLRRWFGGGATPPG